MSKNYLITGGAGFIGSNYVRRLIQNGGNVTIFDNLSRAGADDNLKWIEEETEKGSFQLIKADVRDFSAMEKAVVDQDVIVHLAGQVAVTTSVEDPKTDFDINAGGTFNVLEAARLHGRQPVVLYASTNKVYGGLEDLEIKEEATRYSIAQYPQGIGENRGLDFHSPYGCSKGCGDQYMHDYARIYGIPTVVFRQSCIYGTRQFGIEDQGWVAWFIIAVILGKTLNIFGDGKQTRSFCYVSDLIDGIIRMMNKEDFIGPVNLGNPGEFTIMELAEKVLEITKSKSKLVFKELPEDDPLKRKPDISLAKEKLDWEPKVELEQGLKKTIDWFSDSSK